MTQDQARTLGISMTADANDRAIVHNDIQDANRLWQLVDAIYRIVKMIGHAMVVLEHAHRIDIDREMNIWPRGPGAPARIALRRARSVAR